MEKSASTISRNKFRQLSTRRQHRLLASLAGEALSRGGLRGFLKRYEELLSWTELDRYVPPRWLDEQEALQEYRSFHELLSAAPGTRDSQDHAPLISWQPRFPVEVVMDQVRSPYNVGSIVRIVDNFGFMGVVHSSSWLKLKHPQLCKAARGAQQWIPVRYEPDLLAYLEHAAVPVIGIENESGAVPAERWEAPQECILVLGNESYGIASEIRRCCTELVSIRLYGFKKSMNVHHALSVIAQKIVEKKA